MNTFKFRFIARVILLIATCLFFAWLVLESEFIFIPATVALIIISQIVSLFIFTDRTNRDLSRFLLSIKYDDTSQAFTGADPGSSFGELKEAFRQVMQKLGESRSEMQARTRYLDTIIQHVGVGLLCFKQGGTVDLINNAAKKLLKRASLADINRLKEDSPELVETLLNLKHGDRKLIRMERDGETGYMAVFAHTFILREEKYILISIQNIQEELEEKEMEAWQNLIRVLTHEIMNSITPISSMTATLQDMFDSGGKKDYSERDRLSREEMDEVSEALDTIHQRSQGLMNFVSSYRNMALIPKPKFSLLAVSDLFRRVETLMKGKLDNGNVRFHWKVEPKTLELTADPDLMEQVMINLVLNAIHAVSGRKDAGIQLSSSLGADSRIVIAIEDNGVGIVEEALDKIFIPFFTTKKEGSGIGLSLSRQILRLHNATIRVQSKPDEGTVCTLRFN